MKKALPLALLAGVALGVWLYLSSRPAAESARPAPIPTIPLGEPVAQPSSEPVGLPSPEASPPPVPVTFPKLPRVGQVAREAGLDSHELPPSLMQFAGSLGKRMEPALGDAGEAARLMPDLRDCVLSRTGETPRPAQALCLENARLLSERHPELASEFSRLKQDADPAIVKLAGP